MKQLLKKIILLIGIIYTSNLILAYSLDIVYENNYSNTEKGILNYYIKTQKPEVLLVGSSYVLHGLIPEKVGENCFNLSSQGTHIGYNAAIIDLLDQYNKLPTKTLILHIEPDDLYSKQTHIVSNQFTKLQYYYNKNRFIKKQIDLISKYEFIKYYLSIYRHNGHTLQLLSYILSNNSYLNKNDGFIPLNQTKNDSLRIDKTYKKYLITNKKKSTKFDHNTILYIDHIHTICKKNKIKLIVFSAPFYKTPKMTFDNSLELAKILKKRKIVYLNYIQNKCEPLKNRKYWYDNFHLKSNGAKILSEIVHEAVITNELSR